MSVRGLQQNASGIALLTKSVNNLERFTPTRYVSRDNNLYVVGDISRKCLDTTETNNYQVIQAHHKTPK